MGTARTENADRDPRVEANAPAQPTWEQILYTKGTVPEQLRLVWGKISKNQKLSIGAAILGFWILAMFRYEIVPTQRLGVVLQKDRWTGAVQLCAMRSDHTLKCN